MTLLLRLLFSKPTIVSVLGIFLILIGIPYGIYNLTLSGGASLGGVLILGGVFITFLIYVVDRIAVQKFNTKKLNIIETVLLAIFVSILFFNDKKVIFDISQNDTNYFVLIENNGNFRNSDLSYSFPFDKKVVTEKNNAVIKSIEENYQEIDIETPKNWHGLEMKPWPIDNVNIQFYSNPNMEFSDKEIDSIVRKEIKTVVNSG